MKLQPCSTQLSILSKQLSLCKLSGGFFSLKLQVQLIPAIHEKRLHHRAFQHRSCAVALFKSLRNFLRDIFAKHFLTKSQASNLWFTTLLEIITCLTKIYTTNFILCKRLYLYSHADSDADTNTNMPIPRFPNDHFPGFCQFCTEKKELALEMKNLFAL